MTKRRARHTASLGAMALAALALAPERAAGDAPSSSPLADQSQFEEAAASQGASTANSAAALPADADTPSPYAIAVPTPLPPAVTVTSFINRSNVTSLDWLGPAAGFVAGEMLAGHSGVRTEFGPLVVPRRVKPGESPQTPSEIANFAEKQNARYVITGSFSRPDWELELRVELWEVKAGAATRKGLVINRGEFKLVHQFLSKSLVSLFDKVDRKQLAESSDEADETDAKAAPRLAVSERDLPMVQREPTADFYAFTLFGRGLSRFLSPRTVRDWNDARKNLERATFIDPTFQEGQRVLAEFYREYAKTRAGRAVRGGKLGALAKVRLARIIEARPDDVAASFSLAALAEEADQLEKARDLYHSIVKLRPYDFEARFRLGKLLWDVGQAEDSYVVLTELVKHRPSDIRARRVLVMVHSARGSGEALVNELEKVAKLDPNDQQTRMDLGAAYAALNRNDDAVAVYEEVSDVAGNNAGARNKNSRHRVAALKFLADLYKKTGKRDKAIKTYGLALSAAPWDPRPYFNLGALYVEGGDDDKARRIYQRAARFRRYAPEVHTNLGGIAFRAGRIDDALAHHQKAVTAEPRRARFRYNLALALSADGQLDEADKEVAMGLRYDREHVSLNYLKGVVLLRRGNVDAASIQFEKTLELEPEHEDAMHNLGLIEELRRRNEEGELIRERRL